MPGESPGQRSLAGHSPWGHTESDMSHVESRGVTQSLPCGAGQGSWHLVGPQAGPRPRCEVGGEVGMGWWYEGPGVVGFEDPDVVCSSVIRI